MVQFFLFVSTMKLQLQAKKCTPKYQSPEPHLLSDEGIIPELFKEYDTLLPELNEVLPVTAHHTITLGYFMYAVQE